MALKSYAEMPDDMVERADASVRAGGQATIGADSRPEDIAAAFRHARLMDARPIGSGVQAEIVSVEEPELRRWYVATFAPRLHDKVDRGLRDVGWDFACPMAKEWQAVARPKKGQPKRVAVERPLFGTYGFLHPADGAQSDFVAIEHVDGFGSLVRRATTHEPVRLPPGDLDRFKQLEADGFFDATRTRPPKVKRFDRVTGTSGPFQGVKGIVQMTMCERVKVLMDLLGVVEMSIEAVEVAN